MHVEDTQVATERRVKVVIALPSLSASKHTSAHQSSEESSYGCDHEHCATAWHVCSIAVTNRDVSGRLTSRREKLAAVIQFTRVATLVDSRAPDVRIDEVQRSLC
jgi:hypothetical protein